MNATSLVGLVLIGAGVLMMYVGLYGWTGVTPLRFTTIPTAEIKPSGGGGGGFQ